MRLEWSSYRGDDCLRVTGWSPHEARVLRVYPTELMAAARSSNLESLDGQYHVEADAVSFVPRFPFVSGMSYTVMGSGFDTIEPRTITRPVDEGAPSTRVAGIFPTSSVVPRNLLRLYVHFSNPMSEGFVESHVRVVEADSGATIGGAFLPMEPELWDRDRRRATVLFDPARIKRGLAPHREAGYPLQAGVSIEMVVDRGFLDADGRPLAATYTRRYAVGRDVCARVDPRSCMPAKATVGRHRSACRGR